MSHASLLHILYTRPGWCSSVSGLTRPWASKTFLHFARNVDLQIELTDELIDTHGSEKTMTSVHSDTQRACHSHLIPTQTRHDPSRTRHGKVTSCT